MCHYKFTKNEIQQVLANEAIGHTIYFYDTIGSTNDKAKSLANKGAPEGTIVIANQQTAGRGRYTRKWYTTKNNNLAVSFILRPKIFANKPWLHTIMAGVATALAIEKSCKITTQIKWPNDIWINQKKVAGILVESTFQSLNPQWIVIGIGININSSPPSNIDFSYPVSCIANIIGKKLNRVTVLHTLVHNLAKLYTNANCLNLIHQWNQRMLWKNKHIKITTSNNNTITGIALGISNNGILQIRLDNGSVQDILNGEIKLNKRL